MRAVVQRVKEASATAGTEVVAEIGPGLLALVGFAQGDTGDDLLFIARKLPHLRIFPDESGKFALSAIHLGLSILVVSQFTLFGEVRRGNRPSFTEAEEPNRARELYDTFLLLLRSETGDARVRFTPFGAMLKVSLVNDGPVTIWMDSRERGRN
ncbi:MAG: D-aminoacyl-tRNA deacylase [bacterium JZ-2024 1]